jgi:hypothetical protein
MRPWQHAKSSAQKDGRDWREDLPIHEFLDSTKAANADLRHRMILHNADLGPALAERVFPLRTDVREIALRHVREDMDCEPTLHDWLSACHVRRLPAPSMERCGFARNDLVELLTRQQCLSSTDGPAAVADILLLPRKLAPAFGDAALAVLCNSFGPFIVRQILGPPREVRTTGSGSTVFDPAWTAEAMIAWIMGRRIPLLSEVVSALQRLPEPLEQIA